LPEDDAAEDGSGLRQRGYRRRQARRRVGEDDRGSTDTPEKCADRIGAKR